MSCGVGRRRGLDPEMLWLWRRLAATASIRPLAQESPYATGAALKDKKKKKKRMGMWLIGAKRKQETFFKRFLGKNFPQRYYNVYEATLCCLRVLNEVKQQNRVRKSQENSQSPNWTTLEHHPSLLSNDKNKQFSNAFDVLYLRENNLWSASEGVEHSSQGMFG